MPEHTCMANGLRSRRSRKQKKLFYAINRHLFQNSENTKKGQLHTTYHILHHDSRRVYYGVTNGLENRWLSHLASANRGCAGPLYDILRTEGRDSVVCEPLHVHEDRLLALRCEMRYISRAKFRGLSLNLTLGGDELPWGLKTKV